MPGFKLPKLEYLDISNNKLEKINEGWTGHPNLRTLKAVDNKFKSLSQFKACPKLETVYMAQNSVTVIGGWAEMPALKRLHLRRNKVEKVDEECPPLEALEYLNIRANKLPNWEHLDRLFKNPMLLDINVLNNPVETQTSSFNMLVAEALTKQPRLIRFCKHKITEQNRLDAFHFGQYQWTKREEERARKAAEEAEKAAKEE